MKPCTIAVIPDTQVEPEDPLDHMWWAGQYLSDRFDGQDDVHYVHLGDHAAMRSLSVHDSPLDHEGRTYQDDIDWANEAWDIFNGPQERKNRRRSEDKVWQPKSRRITLGNHEDHITRAVAQDPKLRGKMSLSDLNFTDWGWQTIPFLSVTQLAGIHFSHFFVNNANGRAISGMIETRIKTIGTSFVQGHQQGLKTGMVETISGRRRGIVAGSYYLKSEQYRGEQAAGEWRGILILHQAENGDFDLMEVSASYLCKRFEGVPIDKFLWSKYRIRWNG